ncbi:MAG: HAD-IA family hydrolase [Spirochaetales bacterium]|nr:HAD-IA family hydrolase [Spirochaetales bacterium]
MKFDAVIFDMDGTLLDTIDDIADAANRVLREAGYPEHPRDSYFLFVGNGARKLMERALPAGDLQEDLVDRLLMEFRSVYHSVQYNKTDLYDGIADLLSKLKALGIPLAIVSNKPDDMVKEIAAHYFDEDLFVSIAGQKDHIPAKPDPEGALAAARDLGVKPAGCLFVGDSSVDMDTAFNAGMTGVGVSWGFRSVVELKAHGAGHIIDSPEQLLSLFSEA